MTTKKITNPIQPGAKPQSTQDKPIAQNGSSKTATGVPSKKGNPPEKWARLSRFAMAYVAGAWGMAYVAVKYLLLHGWSGEQVAYIRIIIPGLLLAPLALRAVRAHWRRPEQRSLPWMMLLGVFGFGISHYITVIGQQGASAAVAGLLSVASPLTALLLAAALRIDKFSWNRLAGAALSVCGVVVVVLLGRGPVELSFKDLLSPLLIILGFALVGVYNNLIKPFQRVYTPLEVSAVTAFAPALLALAPGARVLAKAPWGALGLAGLTAEPGKALDFISQASAAAFDPGALAAVFWLGVFAGGLAIFSVGFAVSRIGPTSAASFLYLNPVVSITGGYLLLGEQITPWLLAGAALILGGLFLANRKEKTP